jgi:murein DD-endopeptidase MepM/ murein hydrolase activator NlpD
MRRAAEPDRSPRWFRLAMLATFSVALAGCSADMDRFETNPFRSYDTPQGEVTGSAPQHSSGVQSQALPPPPGAGMQAPATRPASNGTAGGSPGMASYRPQAAGGDVTGSTAGQAARKPAETSAGPAGAQHVHVIAPGETLMKLSRQYRKPLGEIARANNIPPHTMVKVGDRIVIPGMRATQAAAAKPKVAAVQPQKPAQPPKVAAAPATTPATPTARALTPAADKPEPPKAKAATSSAMPSFRWPARGRVISGFGPRPSGQQNDGINLSVPEGTPIKAAEEGVVAYAGNELKSYGNLVLVRHSNGYVTAYAHASEILVKRDEHVKRGQVIGKSGQTGNVAAPQLHFEIRKGSSPLDPVPFLDKGGAT